MTLLKVVWFDAAGLRLLVKRLEKGSFSWPGSAIQTGSEWVELEPTAAALIMDGIELKKCYIKAWCEA